MPLHLHTPLVASTPLEARCGSPVWLKLESAQPSGSFKLRGMGTACERAVARGVKELVTSSGGNAGYAVAWAARRLGVPVTVVVPGRTSASMRARIEEEGARVLVHGDVWDDAHAHAVEIAEPGAYIHPFDHPDVWDGHASLIAEVAADLPAPGVVLVAVGGGGLLAGVLLGMERAGWEDTEVVAVETEGTASLGAALAAGAPVTLPEIRGIALTLGARRVCDEALRRSVDRGVRALTVTDRAAVDAVVWLADAHRILVEPACGAALAPLLAGHDAVVGRGPVLVVVCGGAAASLEALAGWRTSTSR